MEKKAYSKIFNKNTFFWAFILFMLLVKILLAMGLRTFAYAEDHYDDGMMIHGAVNLINYRWLGDYTQYTLAKGAAFPIYLMLIHHIGMPYLIANTLMCFASSLAFILVIRKIIPNRLVLCIFYVVLMFNPINFTAWTFNRVYRDSIYSYLVVLLFSFIIAIYLNRKGKISKIILYAVGAGFFLSAAWLAREDSAWVLPFVAAALILTGCFVAFDKKVLHKARRLAALAIVPVFLVVSILAVSIANYRCYGVFATTELSGGSLPKLVKELSIIQPDQWMARSSIPESSRLKAYEVSPTFAKIKPTLEKHPFVVYANKNPSCQMLVWALLDSTEWFGKKDGWSSQKFYQKSADEIQDAINKGKIRTRGGYVHMFVSPWDNRYLYPLFRTFFVTTRMTVFMNNFDRTILNAGNSATSGSKEQVRQLEYVTNSLVYYKDEPIPARQNKIDLANKISMIYHKLNPFFSALGGMCYLYILLRFLLSIRSKKFILFDAWIITTGIYLSYVLRLLLISYTDISAEFSKYPMYLAAAYWLLPMAVFTSIFVAGKDILSLIMNSEAVKGKLGGLAVRIQNLAKEGA